VHFFNEAGDRGVAFAHAPERQLDALARLKGGQHLRQLRFKRCSCRHLVVERRKPSSRYGRSSVSGGRTETAWLSRSSGKCDISRVGYGDAVAGETDAGGNRRRALDEFLEARTVEGYRIEAHEATHAIVVQGDDSLWRRLLGRRRRRFVVQVDDHGTVSMRPAEPVRH